MKESNMSAGETNVHFREHDIEFLQKRAKLWLEAVLGEKYGDRTFPELISNGNLLYRVSQHITKEMTGASPGPPEVSPRTVAQLDKRHSGKYLPYANVDSFLKTCKKVGLTDVELFSPPDAVEGKDIRQVCTSIRSLARKARAQHIRVPDFEDVNRPLPMPKEKIEGIKENLQHAHSSPVSPKVASPDANIKKSERAQIISKFLSTTTNPLYVPGEDKSRSEPTSPVTPGTLKSSSTTNSPLSTPSATIAGVNTPAMTKSVSDIGPSRAKVNSAVDSPLPDTQPKSSDTPESDALPVDDPSDFPLFSRRALGSFKHAKPHFVKGLSPRSNDSLASKDPTEAATSKPEPEKPPLSPAVSTPRPAAASRKPEKTPSTPSTAKSEPEKKPFPLAAAKSEPEKTPFKTTAPQPEPEKTTSTPAPAAEPEITPSAPAPAHPEPEQKSSAPAPAHPEPEQKSSTPAPAHPEPEKELSTPAAPAHPKPEKKPSVPAASSPKLREIPSTPAAPQPEAENTPSASAVSTPATPADLKSSSSTPKVSRLTTPAKFSSDHSADRDNEVPAEKSNEVTLAKLGLGSYRHAHPHFSFKKSSQGDLTAEPETPRLANGKSKAPSSNKIVENDSRSTTAQPNEASGRTTFGSANKGSGPSAPPEEPAHRPEAKAPGLQLNPGLWVPLAVGALAFVGTLLIARPSAYDGKEDDTLTKISKKGWDELLKLKAKISNRDLINSSEKQKLSSE